MVKCYLLVQSNNGNTEKKCEICPKLTKKHQINVIDVVDVTPFSNVLLLTLIKLMLAGFKLNVWFSNLFSSIWKKFFDCVKHYLE